MDGFIWKNPIKMDDLGVPLFLETPICFVTFAKHLKHYGQRQNYYRKKKWEKKDGCQLQRVFL